MAARFDALLRPYVLDLYRSAYRYTRSREDAEDLVQDLLTKLYPRTPEMEQISDLRAWLARALYNAFIDAMRKEKRTPVGGTQVEDAHLVAPDDPGEDVLRHEQRIALDAAIKDLSPEHRAVVMLHLVEGYTLAELQNLLDIPIGTLKSRLHRARAQLQASLTDMEPFQPFQRVSGHEL